jgi:hypothetical protein
MSSPPTSLTTRTLLCGIVQNFRKLGKDGCMLRQELDGLSKDGKVIVFVHVMEWNAYEHGRPKVAQRGQVSEAWMSFDLSGVKLSCGQTNCFVRADGPGEVCSPNLIGPLLYSAFPAGLDRPATWGSKRSANYVRERTKLSGYADKRPLHTQACTKV